MLVGYSSSGSSSGGAASEGEEEQGQERNSEAQTSERGVRYDGSACADAAKDDADWEPPVLQPQRPDDASASAEAWRHEARVRSFPHIEGMYPTLVMIPVPLGPTELAALADCIHHLQQLLPEGQLHPMVPQLQPSGQQQSQQNQRRPMIPQLQPSGQKQSPQDQQHPMVPQLRPSGQQQSQQGQSHQQGAALAADSGLKRPRSQQDETPGQGTKGTVEEGSLHISLSHCVPVRFPDLELLTGHLRDSLQSCQRPPEVSLQGLTTFCNTDCTRTFLSVPVVQGFKQVVSMTKAVDKSFALLGLRTFHKDPRPHMSIAWMLGDQRSQLAQAISQWQQQQGVGNIQQHHRQQDAAKPASTGAASQEAFTNSSEGNGSSMGGKACASSEPCAGEQREGALRGRSSCSAPCALPRHHFPLQAVICRTPQKDHVVWGELPGLGGKMSSKRRKA